MITTKQLNPALHQERRKPKYLKIHKNSTENQYALTKTHKRANIL
jgi:hypothetical protein